MPPTLATTPLAALPLVAWPHLLATMRQRARTPGAWAGRLTPRAGVERFRPVAGVASAVMPR